MRGRAPGCAREPARHGNWAGLADRMDHVRVPAGPSDGQARGGKLETAQIFKRRVRIDGVWMLDRRFLRPSLVGRSPVVLVHGLGLSGRYMLPTAELLARHFPVYLPDLPGFGDSDKPERALDVPELADALAAWLRAVGLGPAALLGNSFGCQIIADLAARHANLVERAVLQGPTTPADERSWLWQFMRWRQNQPFNPDSLGPITWNDYRKCGLRAAAPDLPVSAARPDRAEALPYQGADAGGARRPTSSRR
jgi:pimeloyl-ACP methyl ester carboxylesterase